MIDPAARARLEWWKASLLDLSTANRLLDAREGRTCIALPDVDPVKLAGALAAGSAFAIDAGEGAMPLESGRLRVPLDATELERRLVTIRRAARSQLADSGEHTLWLALGLLVWGDGHAAPLALWPVELERNEGGALRLVTAEGMQPVRNRVLAEKLRRDFEILLPEGNDLVALLDAADGIVLTRPGWRVDRGALLGCFSFAKLSLWADLDARGDDALASPVVAHLAHNAGIAFPQPSAYAAGAVTARASSAWPSELLAPLDADATQLHVVAAAGAGASFVVQGAPGTGKSQTIANLIVHCVAHGKSVLVASHKVAALADIQQRLASVGLGDFCLELARSSDRTQGRAQVVAQLGRVLDRAFRPGTGERGIGDDRLAELRGALDGRATALHRIGAFGRSLHDVLGRLVELRTAPRAALADSDAIGLNAATFDKRRAAVEALATAAIAVEPIASHPWRASTLASFPPTGRARALAAIDEAAAAGAALHAAVRDVAGLVPGIVARTRDQLQALGTLATLAAASPRPGGELLAHLRAARTDDLGEQIALVRARGTGTIEVPRDPLAFLALASRHRQLIAEVDDRFTEAVADLDAPALWSQLKKWTNSMAPVRFVALRTVRAQVKSAAIPGELDSDAAMITGLDSVIAERACRAALAAAAEPAKRWFGALGGDPAELDLGKLDSAVAWAAELRRAFEAVDVIGGPSDSGSRSRAWRSLIAQVAANPRSDDPDAPGALDLAVFTRLADAVARWAPALVALADATGITDIAGGSDDHLGTLRERTESLRHAIDSLVDWVGYHGARQHALASGIGPAVHALERGDLGAGELAVGWERATLLAWADAELAELAEFHGAVHHAHVAAFADLDRAQLALVRSRALAKFAERVPTRPRPTRPGMPATADGELGVLLDELRAGADHRPLRELFTALPALLPRVAPCLLMTPLSAAEYLAAGVRFDVVVLDEASQLATADAIGVLSRGESAVIVGDSQQLPPTRFFETLTDGGDSDGTLAALESIFDDTLAARLPELRLGTHYRSRHEDVFAIANERYYDDRLQVFPAAQSSPELGIAWRRVDGDFDRATRQNRAEAQAVVAEVLARLRDPAQRTRSLAVITLTRAQQELVEDLLDAALDGSPEPCEPVLVKNVETAQGDERDVVLLSIAQPADDLGPLDRPGGDRRLAVALTRAREQLVVFSSFDAEPLIGTPRRSLDAAPANPITAAIARALADRGWVVRHQVGCGAYKVDLAVVDPNDSERYVLAIEHDGAVYASASTTRDRDRLRTQVLGQLGWRLHRIWSLDWWLDPEREIQRAHAAIVTAIAATRQRRAPVAPVRVKAAGSAPIVRIPPKEVSAPVELVDSQTMPTLAAGSAPIRIARNTIAIGPYTAAAIPPGRRTPDDLFAPRHVAELGKVVEQVLAAEAPMHVDLLARRVGAYFGIGRVTQRVAEQVRTALDGRGRFGDEANVIWRLDQDPASVPPVRVAPGPGGAPTGRRDIDEIPLSELAAAARIVVERANGIAATDLVRDAARLMGFARITDHVTERVGAGVRLAMARELIRIESGKALLPPD